MDKTPYNPTVLLRCGKCRSQTPHALINFSNDPASAITLFYECQSCGETKKVFDLDTLPQVTFQQTKEVIIEEKEPFIPIEKGPQVEQQR